MPTRESRFERIIAAFTPKSVEQLDLDSRSRGRLILAFALVSSACAVVYVAFYAMIGMSELAGTVTAGGLLLTATLPIFRRTGSLAFAAHWVTATIWASLVSVWYFTGGLGAPALGWLAMVVVAGVMLAGRRAGVAWSALCLLTVGGLTALDVQGLTFPTTVPEDWSRILAVMTHCGLVVIIALLSSIYESRKDAMFAAAQQAHDELANARDAADRDRQGAQVVLDHVDQALIMVDDDGRVFGTPSRAAEQFLGRITDQATIWEVFSADTTHAATWLETLWAQLFDPSLPPEFGLAQLPDHAECGGRTLDVRYVPVLRGDAMTHVLVTISDVTAKMRAEEAERRQREQLDIFRRIHRDRLDFMLFFREAEALVTEISEGRGDPTEQLRQVHTLKGNAGLYGLGLLASGMHEVESRAKQDCGALSVESRARVSALWAEVRELVTPLLGSIDRDPDAPGAVHIPLATHEALLQAIARGEDHRALHERVVQLGWQPALIPLQKLREQAMLTCARAGDRQATVRIEGDDVRLPPHRWRHFWSAAVHLVRNAIDHGIEPAAQRAALGKPEVGTITLRAQVSQRDTLGGGQLTLEFVDDGRGIDWGRVRERARALGLPAESQQDLTAAIFADGVSTRDELTETSGRGVGLAAVASATRALDGVIEVESAANGGTCIRFAFPLTTVGAPALRLSA